MLNYLLFVQDEAQISRIADLDARSAGRRPEGQGWPASKVDVPIHRLDSSTEGGTRTHTVLPPDFESGASTNSATPALLSSISKSLAFATSRRVEGNCAIL